MFDRPGPFLAYLRDLPFFGIRNSDQVVRNVVVFLPFQFLYLFLVITLELFNFQLLICLEITFHLAYDLLNLLFTQIKSIFPV
jgi:hypothetical protein